MKSVLFLCTGNSCRSIMAEALLNHLGGDRFRAHSAGSHPTGEVHPLSLATLRRHGVPAEGYRSKSWDEFRNVPIGIVITVCGNADAACPAFPGNALRGHWGMPDPAHATGTPPQVEAAFDAVLLGLKARIEALLALPENLSPTDMQQALQRIGTL